jgi:hypothetical protein
MNKSLCVLVQEGLLYIAPFSISLLKFKDEDFLGFSTWSSLHACSFVGCCCYCVTLILCNGSSKFLYPVASQFSLILSFCY